MGEEGDTAVQRAGQGEEVGAPDDGGYRVDDESQLGHQGTGQEEAMGAPDERGCPVEDELHLGENRDETAESETSLENTDEDADVDVNSVVIGGNTEEVLNREELIEMGDVVIREILK